MATPAISRIAFDGPLFTKDTRKTVRGNIREFLEGAAAEGQQAVRDVLRSGEGSREPIREIGEDARVSQFVVGRVESLTGRRWQLNLVTSPSTKGLDKRRSLALMAAASRLEKRTRAFRRLAIAGRAARHDFAKGLE